MRRAIKKAIYKLKRVFSIKTPVVINTFQGELLNNRVALITGGGSGIGYSIAKSFIENGASVIICGRDVKKLESAKDKLLKHIKTQNQTVEYGIIDITDISSLEKELDKLTNSGKDIDILVNNAGVNKANAIGSTSLTDFESIIKTNIEGTYFISQYFLNYMRKKRIKGNILNIASASAVRPANDPYTISKWGILGFTKGLAKVAIKDDIVVNGIAPGPTATAMLHKDGADDLNAPKVPAGRIAMPEEIANLSTILVSDMSRMVVGDVLFITGGAGLLTYDDIEY